MPIDVLTIPDLTRILGNVTIINDPNGNSGNLTVAGNITGSGTASFATLQADLVASGLTISGGLTVSGGMTATGGVTVQDWEVINGALYYQTLVGGPPTSSTFSQLISGTSSTITMTGSGRIIYLGPVGATNSVCVLTPTGTASATSFSFTNGMEVTLVNINATASNVITIPSGSTGALAAPAIAISGGQAVKFVWMQALGTWVRQA